MEEKFTKIERIEKTRNCSVHKCQLVGSTSIVAVKTLNERVPSPEADRFIQEINVMRHLDHPNVIRVLDYDVVNAPLWFMMPHYESTLKQQLAEGPLEDGRTRRIMMQLLDAVAYAHSMEVIHRDIKPSNILMDANDNIVLSDFGIGRKLNDDSTRLTVVGVAGGTRPYMAPEQDRDFISADERSDIHALGYVLLEMCAGRSLRFERLNPQMRAVIERCTQDNPERRYSSVEELRGVLQALWASGETDYIASLRAKIEASNQPVVVIVRDLIPRKETLKRDLDTAMRGKRFSPASHTRFETFRDSLKARLRVMALTDPPRAQEFGSVLGPLDAVVDALKMWNQATQVGYITEESAEQILQRPFTLFIHAVDGIAQHNPLPP